MNKNKINLSLQVLPKTAGNAYQIVDKAIDVIIRSGVNYKVCPFETVMEGDYDQLLKIAGDAQDACFEAGAEELLVFIKIQRRKNSDVTMEEKMEKYGG